MILRSGISFPVAVFPLPNGIKSNVPFFTVHIAPCSSARRVSKLMSLSLVWSMWSINRLASSFATWLLSLFPCAISLTISPNFFLWNDRSFCSVNVPFKSAALARMVSLSADDAPPENCTSSTEYCPLSISGAPFQPSARLIVALRGGKASLPSWSDNSKSSVSASKPRLSVKDKLINRLDTT